MAGVMKTEAALPTSSRLSGLSPSAIQSVLASAQALELGRVDEADRQIVGLLALNSDHPEVLRLLAGLLSLRGKSAEASATMRRALALRPDDALYLNTLGSILLETGDFEAAIDVLHRACTLDAGLSVAWFNLGIALTRSMRPAEAVNAMRRVLALAPEHVNAQCMLADQLKASGRVGEAIEEYRRILEHHPAAAMAWWGLADIKTERLDANDVKAIRRAMHAENAGDADLIAMGFALAKALDDQGRYSESLDALAQANARARRHKRWDAAAYSASVATVLNVFAPAPAGATEPLGEEVIFIASMPRSGSTLIEQVLASHSQVAGAGELSELPLVLTEESQRRNLPFPHWVPAMRTEDWARLGRRYLERTAHWRTRRPRFTDKLPYNWLYAGAIRAMLPGARIVIGRRDPLETCLSCYRQYLVNNEYTRTFADLTAYWHEFDRAVRHWRGLHPTRVYESVYEALIAEPESKIRELLAFCDLSFEPTCLEFHRTVREVHTPSAAQVREPLRRDTARAMRYGSLLDPLRTALGLAPFTPPPPPA
jgi:tetratricopeptide (TPR) repeat protein